MTLIVKSLEINDVSFSSEIHVQKEDKYIILEIILHLDPFGSVLFLSTMCSEN